MTQIAVKPFENNLDHLLAQMDLLDLRLSREVQKVRQRNSGGHGDEFRGLLVSEEQIDSLLKLQFRSLADEQDFVVTDLIRDRRQELDTRESMSLANGVPLRWERLRKIFDLTEWEMGIVSLGLSIELDLKYEALYGYLQDDVGKKRPTVSLALTLLSETLADRVEKRRLLTYPAPLIKYGLIHLYEDLYGKESPVLAKFLGLDQRLADYLLGSDAIDSRLKSFVWLGHPRSSWDEVILAEESRVRLERLSETLVSGAKQQKVALYLAGPSGTEKSTVVEALCSSLGKPLLMCDCERLQDSDLASAELVNLVFRETLLQDAVLFLHNFDPLVEDQSRQMATVDPITQGLVERRGLTIIAGAQPWRPRQVLKDQSFLTETLALPDYAQRIRYWESHLHSNKACITQQQLASLASKFRFSGEQIREVVTTARDMALWRSGPSAEVAVADLNEASRWHSNQRLKLLAQKISPRYSWEDIVLPRDQKEQLSDICSYFANMPVVYEQWGFQSKTSLGKGLNILFAGPSGTGKTMSSEIMAGELALDLYKIDLATVVSKYIGETEKNLDRIFQEAQNSNAILFFDEADAVFGKRSEVRDAHDRYANIEVSYLLQKMEEYQGIVILATNFRKNIDDAFVRRLHFVVEFPFPEEEYRLQIWRQVFPLEAPLSDSVDLPFLARQFKLSGGNIKNIAVASAFLAVQSGGSIDMDRIVFAAKREYQKMGKLVLENDFGPYFDLVKG